MEKETAWVVQHTTPAAFFGATTYHLEQIMVPSHPTVKGKVSSSAQLAQGVNNFSIPSKLGCICKSIGRWGGGEPQWKNQNSARKTPFGPVTFWHVDSVCVCQKRGNGVKFLVLLVLSKSEYPSGIGVGAQFSFERGSLLCSVIDFLCVFFFPLLSAH